MNQFLTAALTFVALTAPAAVAQRIEERKERQNERIEQGRQSGELTKKEAARIRAKQHKLNKQIREDRRDGGGLSPAERAKIEKRQDNISKEIYKEKHDAQKTAPKP